MPLPQGKTGRDGIYRKLQNRRLLSYPRAVCLRAFGAGRQESEIRNDAYLRQILLVEHGDRNRRTGILEWLAMADVSMASRGADALRTPIDEGT